jgi:Tfp pilus assembly protein PilX
MDPVGLVVALVAVVAVEITVRRWRRSRNHRDDGTGI